MPRARGVLVHSDAAQAVGKIPVDVDALGVDLLTVAGHKLYAPKGVGALYVRSGVALEPLIRGAGHERGLRAGTENVASIVGLGVACELAAAEVAAEAPRLAAAARPARAAARRRLSRDWFVHGHRELRLPNTSSVRLPGDDANMLLARLGDDVAASAGAACHTDAVAVSHVLAAMGVESATARSHGALLGGALHHRGRGRRRRPPRARRPPSGPSRVVDLIDQPCIESLPRNEEQAAARLSKDPPFSARGTAIPHLLMGGSIMPVRDQTGLFRLPGRVSALGGVQMSRLARFGVQEDIMHRTAPLPTLLVAFAVLVGPSAADAGFSATDLAGSSVGRAQGVADWYTTVWVHNPNSSPAVVQFYFLKRDQANTSAVPATVTVPAGDTVRYADVLAELLATQGFGALRVVSDRSVLVSARIYSRAPGEDESASKGQDLVGVPAALAIGAGQRTEILGVYQTQPASASSYRTNYGFVEAAGHDCTVQVVPIDATGAAIAAAKTYTMRAFEQKQYQLSGEFPSVSTSNARLQVQVTSGTGRVIAFGSSIANLSQDPTTFEMRFNEALLGGGAVVHDATLTGDGTGLSPLGVSDFSISKAKLQASGGTSGQVLTTDGTFLLWQTAGLSLPYSASAANGGPLISVTNTSGNAAIQGRSQASTPNSLRPAVVGQSGAASTISQGVATPIGVWGDSQVGNGVLGTSDESSGVVGYSVNEVGTAGYSENDTGVTGGGKLAGVAGNTLSGDGVHGFATTGNGIHGESPGGYAGRFDGKVRISASSPADTDIFTAVNTGAGRGFTVRATTDTALWALSTSGVGIDARSTSGNGLSATSSTGYAGYFFGKVAVTGTHHQARRRLQDRPPPRPRRQVPVPLVRRVPGHEERLRRRRRHRRRGRGVGRAARSGSRRSTATSATSSRCIGALRPGHRRRGDRRQPLHDRTAAAAASRSRGR